MRILRLSKFEMDWGGIGFEGHIWGEIAWRRKCKTSKLQGGMGGDRIENGEKADVKFDNIGVVSISGRRF